MLDDGSVVSSVVFVFEKKKLNSSEFGVLGYRCGGIMTFEAGGEGYLYSGIWMAI